MGNNIIAKLVFKTGKDKLSQATHLTFHDIPAVDIDGQVLPRLGLITEGKKCILIVNVASK